MKLPKYERRTPAEIREHYEIEKELASQLRKAGAAEREYLYTSLYDELCRRVPKAMLKSDEKYKALSLSAQMNILKRFLNKEATFLEVGPGDCSLSFLVAKYVKKIYAIDVSREITNRPNKPKNFKLIISDGCSICVPKNSVDIAYSNQLMEHLHPDDAFPQLCNIYQVLVPGGIYICSTPNRYSGPHDISKYFDLVATGFHLQEYTFHELTSLLRNVGFRKIQIFITVKQHVLPFLLPVFPFRWLESLLDLLPEVSRQKVGQWLPVRILLGMGVVAQK